MEAERPFHDCNLGTTLTSLRWLGRVIDVNVWSLVRRAACVFQETIFIRYSDRKVKQPFANGGKPSSLPSSSKLNRASFSTRQFSNANQGIRHRYRFSVYIVSRKRRRKTPTHLHRHERLRPRRKIRRRERASAALDESSPLRRGRRRHAVRITLHHLVQNLGGRIVGKGLCQRRAQRHQRRALFRHRQRAHQMPQPESEPEHVAEAAKRAELGQRAFDVGPAAARQLEDAADQVADRDGVGVDRGGREARQDAKGEGDARFGQVDPVDGALLLEGGAARRRAAGGAAAAAVPFAAQRLGVFVETQGRWHD